MRDDTEAADPNDPYAPDTPELHAIASFLRGDGATGPPGDTTESWAAVWAKINGDQENVARRIQRHPPNGRRSPWWRLRAPLSAVGAAVVLMLGVLSVSKSVVRYDVPPASRSYRTNPGQRLTVQLASGATMTLALATIARVTADSVIVRGEAYFNVVPRAHRPFLVRTATASVRVLGTRFAVRQYPTEQQSRVVVEDGKVMLRVIRGLGSGNGSSSDAGASTVLSAKMLAVTGDSGITVTPGIATDDYTAWLRGMLVFDGEPLSDAVAEISRAYGSEIRISDRDLAKQTMRMEISSDMPLARVLDAISKVKGAHYSRQGDVYVISPGAAAHVPSSAPSNAPSRHDLLQPEHQYGR